MKLAEINQGVVVNIIEASEVPDWASGYVDITGLEVGIGWGYDGSEFIEPVFEPVVPLIVPKLALVRVARTIGIDGRPVDVDNPSAWSLIKNVIDASPVEIQEDWALATQIPRNDPGFLAVMDILSVPGEVIDQVFIMAGNA